MIANICGIYMIRSKSYPERFYIGSSISIRRRWNSHRSELKRNIHKSPKLQRHYDKYGSDDLCFSVLRQFYTISYENLKLVEGIYIKTFDPYFNICFDTRSGMGGRHHSEETKRKLSVANSGKHPSEETRQKISAALTGIKRSEETKKKMSKASSRKPSYGRLGKKNSPEHCEKIRKGLTGRKLSESTKLLLSKNIKGRKYTEEHRRNISKGRKGIVFTEEHRANISKAQRGNKNRKGGKKYLEKQSTS